MFNHSGDVIFPGDLERFFFVCVCVIRDAENVAVRATLPPNSIDELGNLNPQVETVIGPSRKHAQARARVQLRTSAS